MEFTAVYNTEKLKGVEYSYKAQSDLMAMDFAAVKFNVEDIVIINHTTNEITHLGDKRKTNAILRAYNKKHAKQILNQL